MLVDHGFYDGFILGGGDKAMFVAACTRQRHFAYISPLSSRHRKHYLSWAHLFSNAVRGNIGFVSGQAYHLWHGDLSTRRYAERYEGFDRFQFDPRADFAINEHGAWRWSSDKEHLHGYTREYCVLRSGLE